MSVIPFVLYSQTVQTEIWGYVKDSSTGEAIDFASIVIANPNHPNKVLASAFSDNQGKYQMNVTCDCDSLLLRVSRIEMKSVVKKIPNRSGVNNIEVEVKPIELREVVVKSNKIYARGDTINYTVASFLSSSDLSIADVLKKMPGITVAKNGQISYQGKPIKKFYIEGLDLMKGHYNIASNNINPKDIASVQVLENHQDIKALKGLKPEEQASINIRLKEGVKGVFNLIATLGGGYGNMKLWNNAALGTYFKRNSQFLATYKGNNTGEDLSQELYSFDNDYSRTAEISTITLPSALGIDKRFHYFNRSHNATFNNAYRIGKSGELGINAAYFRDQDCRSNWFSIKNTLPDGSLNIVEETMMGSAKQQKAYGDISFLENSEHHYLKEQVKFDWSRLNANSEVVTGDKMLDLQGAMNLYRLINKFHLTNRSSKYRGYELHSLISIEKRPHYLSVYPNLFPAVIPGDRLYQQVNVQNFSTENSFSLLTAWRIGNINIHPSASLDYRHDALNSLLAEYVNSLKFRFLNTGLGMDATYHRGHVHATLSLPIRFKNFHLINKINNLTTRKNRVRLEPRLSINYKINSSHELSFKSNISYSTPSIEGLYHSNILTSYRQLSAYDIEGLFEGLNQHFFAGYSYKNIISMSFAGIDLSWFNQRPEVLYGSYHDGIAVHTISQETNEKANTFIAKIRGSQGFDWKHLKFGVSLSYSYDNKPFLIQNEVVRYTNNAISANVDISLSPLKWIFVTYRGGYHKMNIRQEGFARQPWLCTINNNASFNFTLPKDFLLAASVDYYYNSINSGDKSFLLFNSELRYTFKHFDFTLLFDNLLNRNTYSYSNVLALTEAKSIYDIRPRSILLKVRFRLI